MLTYRLHKIEAYVDLQIQPSVEGGIYRREFSQDDRTQSVNNDDTGRAVRWHVSISISRFLFGPGNTKYFKTAVTASLLGAQL